MADNPPLLDVRQFAEYLHGILPDPQHAPPSGMTLLSSAFIWSTEAIPAPLSRLVSAVESRTGEDLNGLVTASYYDGDETVEVKKVRQGIELWSTLTVKEKELVRDTWLILTTRWDIQSAMWKAEHEEFPHCNYWQVINIDREYRKTQYYNTKLLQDHLPWGPDLYEIDEGRLPAQFDLRWPELKDLGYGNTPTHIRNEAWPTGESHGPNTTLSEFTDLLIEFGIEDAHPGLFDGIAIAGGCVSNHLRQEQVKTDIDVFVYGLTEEEANQKVDSIIEWLKEAVYVRRDTHQIRFYPSRYYCDVLILDNLGDVEDGYTQIQFIYRTYACLSEILHGFDLGSCAVGAVWAGHYGRDSPWRFFTNDTGRIQSPFHGKYCRRKPPKPILRGPAYQVLSTRLLHRPTPLEPPRGN